MRPVHERFMDTDMLSFWHSLKGPLRGDLRLYGGTALALYLNHRQSTDFDFATPRPVVDPGFAQSLGWLRGSNLSGGPGMVDARLPGKQRQLVITLMETGVMIPPPVYDPVPAPNGVLIAHPFDLVIAKTLACLSREAARDYLDLASAIETWPDLSRGAMASVPGQPVCRVAARIGDPPPAAVEVLGSDRTEALRKFSAAILASKQPEDGYDDGSSGPP